MALSRRSIATLLDLVEIKLGCIEVMDREDQRELKMLRACRDELLQLLERQRQPVARAAMAGAPAAAAQPGMI